MPNQTLPYTTIENDILSSYSQEGINERRLHFKTEGEKIIGFYWYIHASDMDVIEHYAEQYKMDYVIDGIIIFNEPYLKITFTPTR
jgi:hypothetical protein